MTLRGAVTCSFQHGATYSFRCHPNAGLPTKNMWQKELTQCRGSISIACEIVACSPPLIHWSLCLGARPCAKIQSSPRAVCDQRVGDNDFIFVKGCSTSKAVTLLLRHGLSATRVASSPGQGKLMPKPPHWLCSTHWDRSGMLRHSSVSFKDKVGNASRLPWHALNSRGANEYMLEELDRSIHDALCAVSRP
eukprot:3439185-Amphidinium_carterae.1